ncbi:hypothetical protein SAVIM40S_05671 [Streptomyces avidinii]
MTSSGAENARAAPVRHPPAQPQPETGGQRTERDADDRTDDTHGGVDDGGLVGDAEPDGERGDARLAGAEHGALEGEGAAYGVDHGGRPDPAPGALTFGALTSGVPASRAPVPRGASSPGLRPGVPPGDCGGRVQCVDGAEDGHQAGSGGQGEGRVGEERGESDEGGSEDEGDLVQGAFERVDGADDALVGVGPAGQGDRPGAGERADQRYGGSGEGADRGERDGRQVGEGSGDQRGGGHGVDGGRGEDDGTLAVPVGEPAEKDGAEEDLSDGEGAAHRAGGGEGGLGDQQEAAELGHRDGQSGAGVPEVYQGAETEYRALVDPDNRRPAHFPRAALARLDTGAAPRDAAEEKLALTAALLRLRRDRPELFRGYTPVPARGAAADHLVAFTRGPGLLVAATRLSHRLAGAGGWRDTRLPLPPGT